jgi:hypothetical protein
MKISLPSPTMAYDRDNEAAHRRTVEQALGRILTVVPGTGVPSTPPATAGAAGKKGTITWDATHLYVCIADSTWVRCALATW